MKRQIICFVLLVVMMAASAAPAFAASVTDFTDVKPSDWYYDAVDYAASNGLVSGTSSTTFSPDLPMNRSMFITVLGRLAGVPDSYGRTQTTPFTDVTQVDYFFPYAAWAEDNGIVEGSGGRFDPHAEISREQMAAIFHRYAEKFGYVLGYSTDKYNTFTDSGSVSGYAVPAMLWATSHGVINGSDGKLNPQGNASRAQVVQIFHNFSQLEAATPTEPGDTDTDNSNDPENYNPTYDIPAGKSAVDADGGYYDYDLANEIMAQINDLRRENGIDALLYNPKIQGWASIRAQEHTSVHSHPDSAHTRPDGTNCLTVGQGFCFENLMWGDDYTASWKSNIKGYAADVVTVWYNSEGHRQSMLSPAANLGAISCYVKGDSVYIAHLFSMRTLYYMDYLI